MNAPTQPLPEGRKIPEATLYVNEDGQPRPVKTRELFAGNTAIVFALPGAFTPICSSQHLPRYEELVPVFREHGVDSVIWIAVNDSFVMAEWGRLQGISEVELYADGNGEFSTAMGMLLDDSGLGMGMRSRRYSMLVRDGVLEKMLVEPDEPGDPYKVSDADSMLGHVAPECSRPPRIAILTKPDCPWCAKAKERLREAHLRFEEVALEDATRARIVGALTGASSVPQVFADGNLIGGSEELETYLRKRTENGSGRHRAPPSGGRHAPDSRSERRQ